MSDNEKIEAELRAMGYDPAQVGLRGEVFSKAMLGKIQAEARVKEQSAEIAKLVAEREEIRESWTAEFDARHRAEADKSALREALEKALSEITEDTTGNYEKAVKIIQQALQLSPTKPGDGKGDDVGKLKELLAEAHDMLLMYGRAGTVDGTIMRIRESLKGREGGA